MRKVSAERPAVPVKKLVPLGTVIKRDDATGGMFEKQGDSAENAIIDKDLVELVEAAVAARGDGHKPFACQQCLYSARDVWHLRRHIADVHLKRRNYRCKVSSYLSPVN